MEYSGKIIKGIGSFYTTVTEGQEFVCKARGKFRKEGITPVPGDNVLFDIGSDGKGYITEILPRKNMLVRPAAANIDKLMIVMSCSLPRPDLSMVDKLLIQCELGGIIPILLLNKCDDKDKDAYINSLDYLKALNKENIINISDVLRFIKQTNNSEVKSKLCANEIIKLFTPLLGNYGNDIISMSVTNETVNIRRKISKGYTVTDFELFYRKGQLYIVPLETVKNTLNLEKYNDPENESYWTYAYEIITNEDGSLSLTDGFENEIELVVKK